MVVINHIIIYSIIMIYGQPNSNYLPIIILLAWETLMKKTLTYTVHLSFNIVIIYDRERIIYKLWINY